ncbi:MAG: GAF domain-containing protein [Synechococcaceae cyanobacterium SM2_3_1]|nr:GAF domain-containing protein [Synechococcaceae cyanobacterium SM2_3_1]
MPVSSMIKPLECIWVGPQDPVQKVAEQLQQLQQSWALVGSSVQPLGIVTVQDLLSAILSPGSPSVITVEQVMSGMPAMVPLSECQDPETVLQRWEEGPLPFVPVQNQRGEVVGVVTQDHLQKAVIKQYRQVTQSTEFYFQRFYKAFQQSFQLITILTPEGTVLEDNQTALEFCQLHLTDVIGLPFWELPCWNFAPEVQRSLQSAIAAAAKGKTIHQEATIQAPDRSEITIDFSLKPLCNAEGKIEYLLAEGHNISQLKSVEQQLHLKTGQEQSLNKVVQAIRSSLDLDQIFILAANEISQLLQVEVNIVQYMPEEQGWRHRICRKLDQVVLEKLDLLIPDADNPFAARLKQKQMVVVDRTETITDPVNTSLKEDFPGAWLLIPIAVADQVWGSLSLARNHTCHWTETDIDLGQRVAEHLGMAIHQAQLYQQRLQELLARQRVELTLKESEMRLQQILDSAQATIVGFQVFADGQWNYLCYLSGIRTGLWL